ncbi:hypothetical protein Trydic_g1048 [Trypoxylus dichotomus]
MRYQSVKCLHINLMSTCERSLKFCREHERFFENQLSTTSERYSRRCQNTNIQQKEEGSGVLFLRFLKK